MLRSWTILAFCLALSSQAFADSAAVTWLAWDPLDPEPGQRVAVRLMHGAPFAAVEREFRSGPGVRFQHLWKEGRADLGIEGGSPAARILPAEPGVHLVAFSAIEPGGESYAKSVLVVKGAREGSPLGWSELGHRLEIVPQSDLAALAARGGELEVQLLWEREPLAGVTLLASAAAAPERVRRAETDEIGVATFELDPAGAWMIHARFRDASGIWARATLVLVTGEVVAR